MEEVAQKEEAAALGGQGWRLRPHLRSGGPRKRAAARGGALHPTGAADAGPLLTHPCLQDWRPRAAPGGTTLMGPPLPPSQATAPTGTDPQDTRAREFRRSSPRLPAAQPSGICSSCPRRHRGTRSLPIPKSPAHRWLGRPGHRAYWERKSQLSDDIVNETIMWTTFPDVLRDGQDPEVRA